MSSCPRCLIVDPPAKIADSGGKQLRYCYSAAIAATAATATKVFLSRTDENRNEPGELSQVLFKLKLNFSLVTYVTFNFKYKLTHVQHFSCESHNSQQLRYLPTFLPAY